jgi:fluoroacetyl-CoA thioesterase
MLGNGHANNETTTGVRTPETPMKTTLRPGLVHEVRYHLTDPRLPSSSAGDPMVRLVQWACMEAMRPHLGPGEHSVEVENQILRSAAAPAGAVLRVEIVIEKVEGRRICFRVVAYDADRVAGEGTQERFVIDRERFSPRSDRMRARRPAKSAPRRPARRGYESAR